MRVDKYLKIARVLKRRAISKELAVNDRILINDRLAKPSSSVKVGDSITIIFGNRSLKIRVLDIATYTKKEDAQELYEIIEETRINN